MAEQKGQKNGALKEKTFFVPFPKGTISSISHDKVELY
jgi:hypothetical protein